MESDATGPRLAERVAASRGDEDQLFVPPVSPAMRTVDQVITEIAPTDMPVLLVGESGTGKEAVALRIHRLSPRRSQPFVKVDCGAVPPELFWGFGQGFLNENGGNGLSEAGTVFLDEITELTAVCQVNLLHAFPDGDLLPRGHCLGARIISATSRTLEEVEETVRRGDFRKDLYYRVNGVCLCLPPLRERKEDIPALVEFFLRRNASLLGRPLPSLSSQALQHLTDYSWPGNIRELENTAKKIVALGEDGIGVAGVKPPAPAPPLQNGPTEKVSLKEAGRAASRAAEKELILKVLERTHWNRKRAAQELRISYKALLYKLRQIGLEESANS